MVPLTFTTKSKTSNIEKAWSLPNTLIRLISKRSLRTGQFSFYSLVLRASLSSSLPESSNAFFNKLFVKEAHQGLHNTGHHDSDYISKSIIPKLFL